MRIGQLRHIMLAPAFPFWCVPAMVHRNELRHQDFDGPIQAIFFYRAANVIFGRAGRIASEELVLHLMLTKCIPVLLYGVEACPMRKTDLNSLNFVVKRFCMKLFQTVNIDLVKN